jgi:ABC-type antimicrobial peptide transport system permease subunit
VTAYSVARRTNEIGIRMALGADRSRVIRNVMGGAFRQVSAGLVLGLPLAIGAGMLLSAELYGVSPWDPLALGCAAAALCIGSCLAGMIPAARAASIPPVIALRVE